MKRLPSLNAIRAFRKVAETGGISKAALQLHVSQSAVSRFISLLEAELGVALFHRREGFALTPAGKTFYDHVARSFQILEDGVSLLGQAQASLSVKTTPSFALRWLLHEEGLPNGIAIVPRWKGISLADEDFDVGIRWGLGDWPAKQAVPLYEEMLLPVCTPQYLQRHGPFVTAADFARAALVHADPTHHDWRAWADRWSGGAFDVTQGMSFDTLDNALQWALAGQGIAMADRLLARQELASGRLVAAVPETHASGVSYYLVHRPKLGGDSRFTAFADWLRSALSACLAADGTADQTSPAGLAG